MPVFPFHSWLPDAHTQAPTAGSIILAGILLKMGTYGFIRFNLPLFPRGGAQGHAPLIAVLAIIGIIMEPSSPSPRRTPKSWSPTQYQPFGLRDAGHLHA